ncbi:Uncharacterised protein [Pseudomonas aeruginosa]|nr:Uncharacterised protein [Pseudomonas aeruginosa]
MDGADRPPKRPAAWCSAYKNKNRRPLHVDFPAAGRKVCTFVPQHHPDHHRRRARRHRAPGQRRRLPRRQQGQPGNPQLLHEPRLPRRPRPVQARGVGARLHPQSAVRLHPGHRRLRPRRHGHARRQARLRPRPQRYRTAAEGFRRPRAGHLLETGPDRQGQGLAERAEGRHADSEAAIGTTEQRADLPADIRRRAAHLEGDQGPRLHRRAPGKDQDPRLQRLRGPRAERQERPLRRGQRRSLRPRRTGLQAHRPTHRQLSLQQPAGRLPPALRRPAAQLADRSRRTDQRPGASPAAPTAARPRPAASTTSRSTACSPTALATMPSARPGSE